MRIQSIEITNYKAFLGTHKFNVGGKNLFIYGENGSGKSSLSAKYVGTDRVDLLESKEYGYCCLVKTCKAVLDRLEGQENRNITKITPRERINRPLWDNVALREAVINTIIHNDYSTELVPKFEVFTDRLELTSAGTVHSGQEQQDFFAGYSMPRNKTLMRVFKDLGMVEYLGSGMPRILKAYPRDAYTFSTHFIRTTFPISQEALSLEQEVAATERGAQSGAQSISILRVLSKIPLSTAELAEALELESKTGAFKRTIKELLAKELIAYTRPDKPKSRLQKYRLTIKGQALLNNPNQWE